MLLLLNDSDGASPRPRLAPHYHVEFTDDGCLLLAEGQAVRLGGRVLPILVRHLDRGLTVDELVDRLDGVLQPVEVFYGLEQLRRGGHLVVSRGDGPEAAYWSAHGRDADASRNTLAAAAVALQVVGEVSAEPLRAALPAAEIGVVADARDRIVLVDDYLRPELEAIDGEVRQTGGRWLPCRLQGKEAWIGPWLGARLQAAPDDAPGPCWRCVSHRLHGRQSVQTALRRMHDDPRRVWPARGAAPFATAAAAAMVAAQVAAVLTDPDPRPFTGVLALDALAGTIERHPTARRPQCPVCGDAQIVTRRQSTPVQLQSRRKGFTADGGHRTVRPEHTVERHAHLISPITGVVPHLDPMELSTEGADALISLVDSGSNQARAPRSLTEVRRGFRQRNGGKGTTLAQARASALCEALERYSGIWQGDESRRSARLADLGDAAIDPARWLGFSREQYAAREAWNARHHDHFLHVPAPFDRELEIEWTPAWSPRTGQSRLLPSALCFYGYPQPEPTRFGQADSNGTAAGNCLEEAIFQALLELIERDAVSMWWYNRARRPAVDLQAFDLPYVNRALAFHERHHRDLWAVDLTTDFGIPVMAAISRRNDVDPDAPEHIMFGFGAHLDPRIALLRAVTELHQLLPSVERFVEGTLHNNYGASEWLGSANLRNAPHLRPADAPAVGPDRWTVRWADDLRDDLHWCFDTLHAAGLEAVVIDQTRPDVGLNVARVVVPGLRHFWPRFAPGRLFDVPVSLGWLEAPTPESELNPIPVFF